MAVARRGSKLITVGGVSYRWVVSEDSGFKVIVVQHASGSGQRLEASTSIIDDFIHQAVRPGAVQRLIELALARGWSPDANGPPMKLQNVDKLGVLD